MGIELTSGPGGPLHDSGSRTEFVTGAVRDAQEGKGRFDLLPAEFMIQLLQQKHLAKGLSPVLSLLADFMVRRQIKSLYAAAYDLHRWYAASYNGDIMWEVAKHFEAGAKKYAARNWEKGIPLSRFYDSAWRHLLKEAAGHKDEPHAVAGFWNIICLGQTYMWVQGRMLPAAIDDLPVPYGYSVVADTDEAGLKAYAEKAKQVYGGFLEKPFVDESALK